MMAADSDIAAAGHSARGRHGAEVVFGWVVVVVLVVVLVLVVDVVVLAVALPALTLPLAAGVCA
jgi:hypothetical protein